MSLTHEELQESIIGLPDFVLTKISKVIAEYKAMAAGSEALHFDVCPKCGKEHLRLAEKIRKEFKLK